jgi:hypothetical protein
MTAFRHSNVLNSDHCIGSIVIYNYSEQFAHYSATLIHHGTTRHPKNMVRSWPDLNPEFGVWCYSNYHSGRSFTVRFPSQSVSGFLITRTLLHGSRVQKSLARFRRETCKIVISFTKTVEVPTFVPCMCALCNNCQIPKRNNSIIRLMRCTKFVETSVYTSIEYFSFSCEYLLQPLNDLFLEFLFIFNYILREQGAVAITGYSPRTNG